MKRVSLATQVFSGVMKGLGLFIVLFAVIAGAMWWNNRVATNEAKQLEKYDSGLSEFLQIARHQNQINELSMNMKRPIVMVTLQTSTNIDLKSSRTIDQVDPLTLKLPELLRPANAKEVKTVVALYWSAQFVCTYDNGDSGYQQTCHVEVFDRETGALIDQRDFAGTNPPEFVKTVRTKSYSEKHFGSSCDGQIIRYLTTL